MSHYVHNLDPIAFSAGGQDFPWYWLAYVAGFFFVFAWGLRLIQQKFSALSESDFRLTIAVSWVAMLTGGRVFYAVVYAPAYFAADWRRLFYVWEGGMSFHGGLLGVLLAALVVGKLRHFPFLQFTDLIVSGAPIGIFFGRLANFINGELAGRPTDVPWGVIFPGYYDQLPRHPSQLYEALVEGFLCFIFLFKFRTKLKTNVGLVSALFLIFYGLGRFVLEFFREPDAQLGFIGGFTMGQWLCAGLVAGGIYILKLAPATCSQDRGGPPTP